MTRGGGVPPGLRLAWRNLTRKRRRTLLVLLLVAYASAVIEGYWGIVDGYGESVVEAHARYLLAPVEVARASWFEDPDPRHALGEAQAAELRERLAHVRGVRGVSVRLELTVLATSAAGSLPLTARGVEPGAEAGTSALPGAVTAGAWLEAPGQAVLGVALARALDVRVGERLVVAGLSSEEGGALGLRVVGLLDSGIAAVDAGALVLTLEDAGRLAAGGPTSLALGTRRGREGEVARRVSALLPTGVAARSAAERLGAVGSDIRAARLSVLPVGALLSVFAATGLAGTLLVTLGERRRELAVMAALGCAPPALARAVAWEVALQTALGWAAGTALGYAALALLAHVDVLGPLFRASAGVWPSAGLASSLYATVRPVYAAFALLAAGAGALVGAGAGAAWVRRQATVEALRA